MKIIHVIPYFGIGGAETMCETLVTTLASKGHDVIAISLYATRSEITERMEKAGIDVRYLDKKSGFDFSIRKKLKQIFNQEKPDVVHTHLYVGKYVFPVAKKCGVKKIVHTVHSVAQKELGRIDQIISKHYYKKHRVIPVALSETVRETIESVYSLAKSDIPVVFNGVNLTKCIKKDNYEKGETFSIVHVGRFQEVKNHEGLVEAFEKFHNKYANSELILIGYGVRQTAIEEMVKAKNLQESVKFLGKKAEVYEFLHNADLFCLPSHYEGIPMSIIEAMGTGLPIVATNVGGIPDMVDDSCAILTPVDSEEIANAIERYYLSDELRRSHGESAIKMVQRFSSVVMADNYLEVYGE